MSYQNDNNDRNSGWDYLLLALISIVVYILWVYTSTFFGGTLPKIATWATSLESRTGLTLTILANAFWPGMLEFINRPNLLTIYLLFWAFGKKFR